MHTNTATLKGDKETSGVLGPSQPEAKRVTRCEVQILEATTGVCFNEEENQIMTVISL